MSLAPQIVHPILFKFNINNFVDVNLKAPLGLQPCDSILLEKLILTFVVSKLNNVLPLRCGSCLRSWVNETSQLTTLVKVADYLGCSIDELV